VERRAEAVDGGMLGDHDGSHVVASGIGVEGAVEAEAVREQRDEPSGVWVCPAVERQRRSG